MSNTLNTRTLLLRRLHRTLLVGLVTLPHALVQAEGSQLVSFEKSYTELGPTQNQTQVHLKRFTGAGAQSDAISLLLRIKHSLTGDHWTDLNAYFPSGSNDGVCTVNVPAGANNEDAFTATLVIPASNQVHAFARGSHVVRKRTQSLAAPALIINAIIFSGAETPEKAVGGVTGRPLVQGGIVALGGTQLTPALFPARLQPWTDYASGNWTLPLSPQALVIQFGPWKSNKAP